MSERVEPALTPEQWAEIDDDRLAEARAMMQRGFGFDPDAGMALLNAALYGDPRRITRADVALLEGVARDHEAECVDCDWHEDVAPLRALAAKLAALLPPEGT